MRDRAEWLGHLCHDLCRFGSKAASIKARQLSFAKASDGSINQEAFREVRKVVRRRDLKTRSELVLLSASQSDYLSKELFCILGLIKWT